MSDPSGPLAASRQLRADFRWQVPEAFNFTRDVVDRWAADPTRPALRWRSAAGEERRLSFADVSRAAARAAGALASLGVGPGDPLLVMLGRSPAWPLWVLGGLKAGALVIPCSTLLRPKDLVYRVAHSGAAALVTDPERVAMVDAERAALAAHVRHFIVVPEGASAPRAGWLDADALLAAASPDTEGCPTRAADPALVYYTSGTTGPPKAVLHHHAYTFAHRYTAQFWHGLREGDRLWTTSDTGWAKAAYGVLFGPWSLGAEVCLYEGRFEPSRQLDLLESFAPQVFCAPPTEFRLLVKQDLSRRRFPGLREVVSAGEPLNPEVIRAWRDATDLPIRDGYGQTETILLVGNFPGVPLRPGSMGLPMPGHEVAVIDEAGQPLPPGEVGDVAVRRGPPSLFAGYWRDPEATARCRRGSWYVTGDRASVDGDGYFWFVGRADDVIISAGYRIGPFEVESALLEHPEVLEAAAVAAPDATRGSVVKAFVVLRTGADRDDAMVRRLQEHVKAVTAPYKYPRVVEFVDELPKTVSGKIRRVELRGRG